MSTLKIEERITVAAPPARVFAFLLDPARVAPCLPGARLDGTEGDATFLGTMKIKVGPVQMELKGKATLSEVVEAERRVTMIGTGNDKSGGGSAKMVMKSRVVENDGGSEIVVEADVDLAGKMVRFGRGMMEGISKQLFKQFAERVQAELTHEAEAPAAEEPKAEAPKPEEPKPEEPKPEERKAEELKVEEPKTEEPKVEESKPEESKPEESKPEEPKVEEPKVEEPKVAEPKAEVEAPIVKKTAAPIAREPEALDAGSLVWSALWAWIKGLFRRLFGQRR